MDEFSGLGMTSAFCPTFLFQPNVYIHYGNGNEKMTLLLHGRSARSQGALSADHSLAVTDEIFLCRKRVVERKYVLSPSYNWTSYSPEVELQTIVFQKTKNSYNWTPLYSPEVERQTIVFQKTKNNPCRGSFQKK